MKVLIIGYGSIGQKHHKVLKKISSKFIFRICSKLNINSKLKIQLNEKEIENYNPDYIIISSETYLHFQHLKFINKILRNKLILIEKPLFHSKSIGKYLYLRNKVFVAYNLRFDPILIYLKKFFTKDKIKKLLTLTVYCGSYLPNWRKSNNYTESYSADPRRGGGVELDLSHEFDYLNWIFGDFQKIKKINDKISSLNIKSNDLLIYLAKLSNDKYLNLTLNYFSKIDQRFMIIETNDLSMEVDLVNRYIKYKSINDLTHKIKKFKKIKNISYIKMHQSFTKKNFKNLCSYNQATKILSYL